MKTNITFVVVTCVAVLTNLLPTLGMTAEVRVYNWSDYIEETLLEKFEHETGLTLIYDVFDSNELLETKMLVGGSGYDVVVPSHDFLQRQIEAGAFQKLDPDKLPNKKHLWDAITARMSEYDPDNAYSINYMWGTTGIGVNINKVREVLGNDAPIDSLALIFDPENMKKLSRCGVYFLDSSTEVIPAALIYVGENPVSHNPDTLKKAADVLMAVRPYVQKFHNSEYTAALSNGNICVAFGWSGDILLARDRADEAENGVEIVYNIPMEGAQMWFDQMAVPVDAPNPDGAHQFLNFMMDPENIAIASNYVYYANGNKSSQELLDEDVIDDTAIYPDEKTLQNLYAIAPYPPKIARILTRLWTKIKSGI